MLSHKVEELLASTGNLVAARWVSLEETQKVAGRINHLTGPYAGIWPARVFRTRDKKGVRLPLKK
jgi:hypothetical protein